MSINPEGRAWVYGDNIDTDQLAPIHSYKNREAEEGCKFCLEALDPDFAGAVEVGDIFVAGANMGIGSSREQAPLHLKLLGIRAVLAKSFARIFYRNTLNFGVPALVCADVDRINAGDTLRIDPLRGQVANLSTGETLTCEPLPEHLMEMIAAGGLMAHLRKKFKQEV
ncbi:MAG: 3-isopropylmalate dehydratase [Rhodospirillales bacterium]|nr:3-isopropylmalate dehydratase [Rhodospirillales bacterium]